MKTSESINELAAALAKAQAKIKSPGKDKTAEVPTKSGGVYSYKYSDLASLLDAIREPFAENGLCLVQPARSEPGCVHVVTRVMHASGQWMEEELTMPVGDNRPQTMGSAITYARRYGAGALVGVASEEDDDGAKAQEAAKEQPGRGRQPAKQQRQEEAPPDDGTYQGTEAQRNILRVAFERHGLPSPVRHAVANAMKGKPMTALEVAILGEKEKANGN